MTTVFVFAITLLVAVLISNLADRSVLSTAVLFLIAGVLAGEGVLGVVNLHPDDQAVAVLAELALFSVLFTDGMKVGARDLATAWVLPGRALLFGLPLTLVGTALLAHFTVALPWAESFLLGAILSPTDPVFAAAIVGREEVPARLRQLLNVESGLNDGLALPIVLAMLAVVAREKFNLVANLTEIVVGIVIGVVVPFVAINLERTRFFAIHATYRPLNGFAIGLLVLTLASKLHGNEYLAAFAAGITIATIAPEVRESFHHFGELVAELLKLAALLVFGSLISPQFLAEISVPGYLFALLAIIAVRPIALMIALVWSPLDWQERVTAAWFGPKGFASVVFGLLILHQARISRIDLGRADQIFHLVALCITGSIIAHSSTDVLVARWFRKCRDEERRDHPARADPGGEPVSFADPR